MPRAIDTNVLLRVLVEEDSDQGRRATKAFWEGDLLVPLRVLLETEWVMRSRYRLSDADINAVLTALIGSSKVEIEREEAVRSALTAHAEGMDFADALHLFGAGHCSSFLSFDRDLQRRARHHAQALTVREP
jgi:predicted nucleic-acid-binding protein